MNVIICDDHPVFCMALQQVVASTFPEATIQVCHRIDALRALAPPDLLTLDLALPDGSGLDVLAEQQHTPAKKVVISASTDRAQVRAADTYGAAAYLDKSASAADMAQCFTTVMRGGRAFPLGAPLTHSKVDRLLPRQKEILALVAQGLKNRDIARAAFISENTVKTHLRHIFAELDVDTRTAAAMLWRAHQ